MARALWREPVAWLVVGLPLGTIIAAVITIRLAGHDGVDASAGQTQRIAQVQIEDLQSDREAAARGLEALIAVEPASGRVIVTVAPDEERSEALALVLAHPIDAAQDRTLLLTRAGGQWHGTTTAWSAEQAWEIALTDVAGHWRLKGRLERSAAQASLHPAVAP